MPGILNKFFFILILIVCMSFALTSVTGQCNPPNLLPTVECDSAPLLCLNNYCANTINVPYTCCLDFCGGNTIVNNPQYFEFIASASDVEIDIHVDNCSGGTGIQSAIVSSCDWAPCPGGAVPCPDVLACNPGTNPGGTMVLIANGLIVDNSYWLLIDGFNGATCGYTINYVAGIYEPANLSELDSTLTYSIPETICPGFYGLYVVTGPPPEFATGYYWTFGWNEDTLVTTSPELSIDLPANIDPGIWDICVHAFNGCDTTDIPVCTPIEVMDIPTIIKMPSSLCLEDFPFLWHGIEISGPGIYTSTFVNANGCAFDSVWQIFRTEVTAEASFCCDRITCESCTSLDIQLWGTAPWSIYISDGAHIDTVDGIQTSPYEYQVCVPADSAITTYTLLEVRSESELCPGRILGTNTAIIEWLHTPEIYFISDSLLCADISMAGYEWTLCDSNDVLATTQCFHASATGCYCVTLISGDSCQRSFCQDLILNTHDQRNDSGIIIFPNPIKDVLHLVFEEIPTPACEWIIYNVDGQLILNGKMNSNSTGIDLDKMQSGVYFIWFKLANGNNFIKKFFKE